MNLAVLSSGAREVPTIDVESKMLAGLRQKPLRQHAANSIDGMKERDRHDLLARKKDMAAPSGISPNAATPSCVDVLITTGIFAHLVIVR
jgi:hypothetical protein